LLLFPYFPLCYSVFQTIINELVIFVHYAVVSIHNNVYKCCGHWSAGWIKSSFCMVYTLCGTNSTMINVCNALWWKCSRWQNSVLNCWYQRIDEMQVVHKKWTCSILLVFYQTIAKHYAMDVGRYLSSLFKHFACLCWIFSFIRNLVLTFVGAL